MEQFYTNFSYFCVKLSFASKITQIIFFGTIFGSYFLGIEANKMKKTKKNDKETESTSAERLAQVIIHGMQEKKAVDITLIDLRDIKKAVADFFVICSGTSDTHTDAITQSIDAEVIKALNEEPWHIEGRENRQWILLDYVDVVAHVFQRDTREFFSLEELWGDARIINVPNPA